RVGAPEPTIALSGNPIVKGVSDRSGNNNEGIRELPGGPQAAHDVQDRSGAVEHFPILHEDHALEIQSWLGVVLPEEPSADLALQRGEEEVSGWVPGHNETHPGVAEIADSIEENDRFVVG